MKTRNWLLVVVLALGALGLIVGVGFDDLVRSSSPAAADEAEMNLTVAEYQDFSFGSENINKRLREYEALEALDHQIFNDTENINQKLREYEASTAVEYQDFSFGSENINQILREYEASSQLQDARSEQADSLLQREIRFNLPEGTRR